MKKNRFPVMMIALAAAALLGITVWRAALENGAQEEKKTSLRIGVLLYRGDDTFIGHSGVPWSRLQRSMNRRRGSG